MTRPDNSPTITRLLGPAEPEILCDECFEQLDVYVDAELAHADADATVPGMRAHLEGCPACSEEYESLRALVQQDAWPAELHWHAGHGASPTSRDCIPPDPQDGQPSPW